MAEAQTYLSNCILQRRSIYSNRTVSYAIVLLELLTVLLEYIDLSVIATLISKDSYYYTNILPIMLALCSMLSGTYYAHNYASIIGGSLLDELSNALKFKGKDWRNINKYSSFNNRDGIPSGWKLYRRLIQVKTHIKFLLLRCVWVVWLENWEPQALVSYYAHSSHHQ